MKLILSAVVISFIGFLRYKLFHTSVSLGKGNAIKIHR